MGRETVCDWFHAPLFAKVKAMLNIWTARRVGWFSFCLPELMLLILVFVSLMTSALPAAIFTWQPSGDGSWTNAANWSGGTLPTTTSDTANFNTVITSPATVTLDGNQNINKINFSSAAAVGWTINPGTPGSSTLTLGGASPGIAVSLGTGGSATIGVVINSTTGWSYSGSSGLSLTGANTFNAPVTIQSATSSGTVGMLTINSLGNVGGGPSALGAPSTAANGVISLGRLSNLTYTGPATTSDRLLKFISSNGGQTTINNSGSGLLTLTGGIANSGNGATFILRGAEDITESGVVSLGAAGLLKTDAGTLTLTGSNTFSGGTTVAAGTFLVNNSTGSGTGSGMVTVSSGATFGGTGHISGGVVFNSGANASFTVGSPLTIGGSLTISNNPVHLNIPFSLTNGTYSLATYNNSGSTGSFGAVPLVDSGSLPTGKVIAVTASGGAVVLSISNPVVTSFIYYVSTNGNDAYTSAQATNSATPWRTISHAATNLNAGDTCLIRGGTYRETVAVPVSGVANAPVTFQAYSNEVVTIDGTDPISGWSTSGGNLWSAPMNWTLGTGDQVFSNQTMLPSARWPNAGSSFPWQNSSIKPSPDWTYTTAAGYDANGANGWFSDTNLPSRPDGYWNGATVNILNGKGWVMNHMTVLGYTNGTRTIQTADASGNNVNYALIPGNEFYLTGVMGELDSQGEWFYTNSLLYLYSTNTPAGVTAKHRQFGFDLRGRAFITLSNLNLFACNIQSDANSTDETFDGLVMLFPGYSSVNSANAGLTLYDRSVLRNSELAWDSYSLLTFAGDDIRVINNYVHDSGFVPGWPAAVNVVAAPCYRNLFSHNTITNTGRESIGAIGKASIIEYNDMSNPLKLESDGGVLHITYEAGNTVVRYNRLHDAPGPKGHTGVSSGLGFYLDSQCSNWIVHHNCMWNVPFGGIQVNPHRNFNLFYNNTVWGANTSLSGGLVPPSDGPSGVCFFNNLFNTIPGGSPWTDCDLRYNFYTNTSFVAASNGDFRLQATSSAIGAGTVIPGVTDDSTGTAPDLGAFEYGGANWATNTGCSPNPPSPDPTYNFTKMAFANQIVDGSFESGSFAPNWATNAGSSLILLYSSASAWTDTRLHMGYYSVQFNPGTSGISQTITGLLANCAYQIFAGIEITNPACTAVLGATNCGPVSATLVIPGDPLNTNLWTMFTLPFTTGQTNTSAQIYLNVTIPNGATPVYADDLSVQVNTLGATNAAPYSSPSSPAGLSGITNGNFQLSWTATPGATYYSVLHATTSGGPFTILLTGLTTNIYTETNPVPFATNYYIVTAGNAFGVSSNSAQVSFAYMPALYFRYAATTNIWNSASNYWGTASGGPYTNLWTDYDTATFEGTGGLVYINGIGVNVYCNLSFNVNGYTLAATNAGVLNLRGSNVWLNASNTVQFSAPLVTDPGSLLNFNCPNGNTAVVLSGTNTIGGQINITQGKVLLNYSYVLTGCAGVTVGNGGSLQVGNSGSFTINGIPVSIAGAGVNGGASALQGFSSSACGWGGPVTLTGNSSIGARQGAFTVSGVISDNGSGYGVTMNNKIGVYASGTVILSAFNNYGGATSVATGTLLVNGILGSGAVTVSNTATLGGGGILNGPVTVQSGGTLAPGAGGMATLTISNTLTLLAGSTNLMQINGSTLAGDQIAGVSAVTYGGSLIVTNIGGTAALTNGARVVLFSAATYNPSAFAFTNLPPLATNQFWDVSQLAINGSLQVKSVVVPTPVISRVVLTGGSLVIQGTNGLPGSGYSILTATNLSLPFTQWLTNTTDAFNGFGWFSNGLPFNSSEPQRFYRVRTP